MKSLDNNQFKYNRYDKVKALARIRVYFLVIALNILFIPSLTTFSSQGNNRFVIKLGETVVGVTDSEDKIYGYYRDARIELASASGNMTFMEYQPITYEGEEVIYGETSSDREIIDNMKTVLSGGVIETMTHGYLIKVDDMAISVASADEVRRIFQSGVDKYDMQHEFTVELAHDTTRELNVLTPIITKNDNNGIMQNYDMAGFEAALEITENDVNIVAPQGFDSFDYGIESMEFSDRIEIVEAYIPSSDITDYETARSLLLEEQEVQQIYKVQSGDTLSEISIKVGLPLDEIIALNDELENEHSTIRIDQELIITVPEPALSIVWTEQAKLEEAYNLPIEYTYNDDWYTNEFVTHQQPSAGYHEAVLLITHENDNVVNKDTVYEEVIMSAVAKQVEIGTIVPPTYIKPLAGGRMTSGFGYRRSPTSGASSNHKGIDWSTPIGTSIYAASGGTVVKAGWSGGYGYAVLIQHPDGRQTRYAHCSRVLVSAGQYVNQGQVIALSGNTGISTGPHLHFEILINGVQVNPLEYL